MRPSDITVRRTQQDTSPQPRQPGMQAAGSAASCIGVLPQGGAGGNLGSAFSVSDACSSEKAKKNRKESCEGLWGGGDVKGQPGPPFHPSEAHWSWGGPPHLSARSLSGSDWVITPETLLRADSVPPDLQPLDPQSSLPPAQMLSASQQGVHPRPSLHLPGTRLSPSSPM